MSRRIKILIGAGTGLLAVFLGGGAVVGFYADYHWFRSLDQPERFWRLAVANWAAWTFVFVLAAGGVGLYTWRIVRKGGPIQVRRKLGDLEIAEALPEKWIRWAVVAASGLVGLLVASPFAPSLAQQTLYALHAEPFGDPDPVLGQDPRFYIFYLPLLRTGWSVMVAILTWAAFALATLLLLSGRIQATQKGIDIDPFARRRLVNLGAAALLLLAGHFALSVFETVAGGPVGYSQVHGEIPGRRLMTFLAVAAAAALVYSERVGNWRPAISVGAATALVWPLAIGVYPELIQRFRVQPNELELERPYIAAEVDATREAFGLTEIRRLPYDLSFEPPDVETALQHTSSIPLWDERPLTSTYNQLQGLLAFHEFPDVDADRYGPPGQQEQVAIGVREFSPDRLDPAARTWQNLHLRYTYGQGVVVTAVDRATEGGEPHYFLRDIPPTPSSDVPEGLEVREPKIHFGERTIHYALIPPDSFPEAGPPTGVDLSGLTRRALFAWALESVNLVLRDPGGGTPRLAWNRQVVERVRELTPFLRVDPDPYPVVHDGRVKWIVEMYVATRGYPLSQSTSGPGGSLNYLRSVGKGVVDAVTGETTLYVVEPDDPLFATFQRTFPELFTPLEEMPEGLRRHLRYPPEVFAVQGSVLEAYHMTDPEQFYYKQDLWSIGREVYDRRPVTVEPYFLLMPFPGNETASGNEGGGGGDAPDALDQEFILTLPFTPRARDNLSSFLMARNDGEHYGELWLFELSGQRQVFGPRQVEVQIDQDAVISQQLSLWQQLGSRAIRGHLYLVPVNGFLLYVEPLFLVAEDREGAAPGLKRVIAAAGDRVAMGEDLEDALLRLLGERARTAPLEGVSPEEAGELGLDAPEDAEPPVAFEPQDEPTAAPEAPADVPAPGPAPEVPAELRPLLEEADRALRTGDLVRFGQIWEEIRTALEGGEDGAPPGDGSD